MTRLRTGCGRLRLPPPDPDVLWQEVTQVSAGHADCVVRISVTRGAGERGYALPIEPRTTRIVAAFAGAVRRRRAQRPACACGNARCVCPNSRCSPA